MLAPFAIYQQSEGRRRWNVPGASAKARNERKRTELCYVSDASDVLFMSFILSSTHRASQPAVIWKPKTCRKKFTFLSADRLDVRFDAWADDGIDFIKFS